jgi:hypothetical protein
VVLSESELVDAVARDKAAGRTIALANGCFDLHARRPRSLSPERGG